MTSTRPSAPGSRLSFIDDIRWVTIVLVLSMHAADTYSPFGNWYYTEHPNIGIASALFFATYQSFLQAFFMGLLFFIAGYFTPRSFDHKGSRRFVIDRAVRLGAPTLLYMVAIGPLTEYYVAHSWHTSDSFARAWWGYVVRGQILSGTGPLWFCAALLIFSLVYAGFRSFRPAGSGDTSRDVLPRNSAVLLAIGTLAVTTFAIRLLVPAGFAVFNFQLADFPQYILMFSLGLAANRRGWLDGIETAWGARWCVGALAIGAVLWVELILLGGALQGQMTDYSSGWHWQSFGTSLWGAIICVGMSLGTIVAFRAWRRTQGRFARFMSANAFAVYVFHPPILISLAILLHPVDAPAVLKFVLLTVAVTPVVFLGAQFVFRQVPGLNRIL